jgi:penicillin-insensitive murein endopeptidase
MIPRLILLPLIALTIAANAAGAWAQDKGTVNPKPLPPLANPNDPKVAAKELFGRKVLPAAMPTRVHGFYAHGCIAGAEGLPINGDNWQVMRLSRNRNWGHPDLVALVKRLAAKARKDAGWPGILVGDMSQPRGGPMLNGHTSHQIGLDADIWLTPMPDRTLTRQEREDMEAVSMLKDPFSVDPDVFTTQHVKLIKRAASYPQLSRIFVHPAIKKALCEQAASVGKDRAWLGKVRPWWNHHYHFHVRLSCPPGAEGCENQKPVLGDDGCGQELKNWYAMLKKSAIWAAELQGKPQKPAPKKNPIRLADLPKDCGTVIAAGGNKPVALASAGAMPMAPVALAALSSKEAGPPVPLLDAEALKALRSGKMTVPASPSVAAGMPLPDRNPIR